MEKQQLNSYKKAIFIFISFSILVRLDNLLRMTTQHFPTEHLELTSLSGFFIQDDPAHQEPQPFHVYHPNASFGLIHPHSPHRWIQFQEKISLLQRNRQAHLLLVFDSFHPHLLTIKKHVLLSVISNTKSSSSPGMVKVFITWPSPSTAHLCGIVIGWLMSLKTTDGELVWGPDARLSELGKAEAHQAETAWTRELANHFPVPEIFIVSPLSRAIETMVITGAWKHSINHSENNQKSRPRIVVKEKWRENIGSTSFRFPSLHTQDQSKHIDLPAVCQAYTPVINEDPKKRYRTISRSSNLRTDSSVPDIEDLIIILDCASGGSFVCVDTKETDKQLDIRIKAALTDLFVDPISSDLTCKTPSHLFLKKKKNHEDGFGKKERKLMACVWTKLDISITAHSGVISSLLRVLGHRPFPIEVSGVI
ncbi:hypothetical protein VP01_793g1 [Puccinia sorghi]|uniref:Uncharacterized protein n=1 Tax=Puccinia sorghi TaxID=27349 RepID=A0A0L6UCV1_9BASI|nr:hypothetical protein VP01_793g1 [Puccinia sorghi]